MNTNLILVNQNDEQIGEADILNAHLYEGKLHRAFTAILRNNKGEMLLAKRALNKPMWGTYWDGSFSSHPRVGETLEDACIRRAREELGIETSGYKHLFSYSYHFQWSKIFCEREVNHILIAEYNTDLIQPNPDEVSDFRWVSWQEALEFSLHKNNLIAPWWVLALKHQAFPQNNYE